MCHNDFGPWNLVSDGDEPAGIIDWDFAHLAHASTTSHTRLEYAAPFRDDATMLSWHHFTEVPNREVGQTINHEAGSDRPLL